MRARSPSNRRCFRYCGDQRCICDRRPNSATREPSIKQLLAAQGIECRSSKHFACKELWRGDEFLGDFSAGGSVKRFLSCEKCGGGLLDHADGCPEEAK